MKTLVSWMKTHPFLAVIFTAVFTFLATCMALLNEDGFFYGLGLFGITLALWAAVVTWQTYTPAIVLLLSLSLAAPQPIHAHEPNTDGGHGGGGCVAVVVGVIVICVGGYCIYKMAKFCQKKFPKSDASTNSPPEALSFSLGGYGGSDSDAAAFNFAEMGSCLPEDPCNDQRIPDGTGASGDSDPSTTFSLTLRVDPSPEPNEAILIPLSLTARRGSSSVQNFDGFVSEMKRHGVTVTGHAGQSSFARNGIPIDASQSPISWDSARGVAKVSRSSNPYYLVLVQRSPDLLSWTDLLRTEIELGSTIRVDDTNPSKHQFYRYSSTLAD